MAHVFSWLSKLRKIPGPYDPFRLVNTRTNGAFPTGEGVQHVVSDIDKTYLETEFESLLGMAKIAFEKAVDKVTVSGARDIMRSVRWGLPYVYQSGSGQDPRPLHFVSSTPHQLRRVLEEKLMMDGLDWTSDTFKNQAYNLRMRRMDQLKQHVAYKSAAILGLVTQAGVRARFYLLGDNAEQDTYIYLGVALACSGLLSRDGYSQYLQIAGVDADVAQDLVNRFFTTGLSDLGVSFDGILIRKIVGYQHFEEKPFTSGVTFFDGYFEAGLALFALGVIPPANIWQFTRSFHNSHRVRTRDVMTLLEAYAMGASEGAFRDEALAVLERWRAALRFRPEGAVAPKVVVNPLVGLRGLPEDRILDHAKHWIHRLLDTKTQRKSK